MPRSPFPRRQQSRGARRRVSPSFNSPSEASSHVRGERKRVAYSERTNGGVRFPRGADSSPSLFQQQNPAVSSFNMKTRTSLITSSVAFVCVVGVVGKSAVAMEETPSSSLNLQHYNAMLNSMGFDEPAPEKRAYTYVSEYKRLPVYNFGIGKRWIDNSDDKRGRPYSFGLGKRTKQYSFGLGKRNESPDYPVRMNMDYVPLGSLSFHSQENLDDLIEEKRGRQPYSFGLGKRAVHMAADEAPGNGKRPTNLLSQRYHFGLGKRMSDDEEDTLE